MRKELKPSGLARWRYEKIRGQTEADYLARFAGPRCQFFDGGAHCLFLIGTVMSRVLPTVYSVYKQKKRRENIGGDRRQLRLQVSSKSQM